MFHVPGIYFSTQDLFMVRSTQTPTGCVSCKCCSFTADQFKEEHLVQTDRASLSVKVSSRQMQSES